MIGGGRRRNATDARASHGVSLVHVGNDGAAGAFT
jgi:hypothetical protein